MSKSSKSKYYVVWVGQKPGIYDSWKKCQEQVVGFPDAKYKSFKSYDEAKQAFDSSATNYISKETKGTSRIKDFSAEIISDSISVDAACSGNPGIVEYQGVHTISKEQIFHMGPFQQGTNNIGEYLGLVHGLALLKKQANHHTVIYTDSKTAMSWVRNKKVKTTLKQDALNADLFLLIKRATNWLMNNNYKTQILKWETKKWGEIPADFGRK